MLSVIAIVMWLFCKVSTYPELGQIRNWPKNCSEDIEINPYLVSDTGNISRESGKSDKQMSAQHEFVYRICMS